MPPTRNGENSGAPTAGAMAECVLPEDMMLCILTRLPVKSIHRFKGVCKPLRHVLSSPEFAKMHRYQFPQNPENQSVIICDCTAKFDSAISMLKIESEEKKRTKVDIPFHQVFGRAEFVGCCNGLLCMVYPQHGQLIALWNPALNNMFKFLPLPDLEIGDTQIVSVGFGYNEEADDFKVIIVVELVNNNKISVEVYSANSDSWSTIDVGFHFTIIKFRNDAIVNGSPYWDAFVDHKEILVCFDVRKMVLNIVHLPDLLTYEENKDILFVDWKGGLGAIVRKKRNGKRVDVWVFDDDVGWTMNCSFRPPLKVCKFFQCFKNGKILVGECCEFGELFVLDTENGGVKETGIDWIFEIFEVYGYIESLAYIKGMETSTKHYEFHDW